MKRNAKTVFLCQGAIIAALYVVLTYAVKIFGLDSGVIQVRVSEMLCILPIFTPAAIPGLYLGCLLSNLLAGAVWLDIVVGPIATLIGALGTYFLRKLPIVATLPPVAANALIVPFVLAYGYGVEEAIPFMMLTVGIGELISVCVLGTGLYFSLKKHENRIFKLK
ncbi:MAG: QueT transporter family protein [Ruminococcaceae bacterium]|nr:QueT transporter family protein [Oscillospiraceae bacterium]